MDVVDKIKAVPTGRRAAPDVPGTPVDHQAKQPWRNEHDARPVELEPATATSASSSTRRRRPSRSTNFLDLRREGPLRRHGVPPRHPGLHGPGRRLRARHEAEAHRRADQERGQQRPEERRTTRVAMARTSAPHSATAQFFINAADNAFLELQVARRAQGWGYAVFGKVVEGTEVVDAIEQVKHRQQGRPRRRAARRRDDHTRHRRVLSREGVAAHGARHRRCPLPSDARRRLPEAGARSTSSPTCTSARARPRTFDAWAAHLQHTPADAVFILGDLFEVWVGDDMRRARLRGALRRGAGARPPPRRTSPSWPATATSWSATPCSKRCGVMRLRDPTRARRLRPAGAALARRRAVPRRRRLPALPRASSAVRACSAPCWRCHARWRSAIGRRGAQAERRDRRPKRGDSPTSTPTRRAAGCARAEAPVLVHGHTHAPASHDLGPGLVRHVLSDWDLDGAGSRARGGAALDARPALPGSRPRRPAPAEPW